MSKPRLNVQPESRADSGIEITPSVNAPSISSTDTSECSLSEIWEPTRVISCENHARSEKSLQIFVLTELRKWSESSYTTTVFTNIPLNLGVYLFGVIDRNFGGRLTWDSSTQTLRIKMPTRAHNFAQTWINETVYLDWTETQKISTAEVRTLITEVGTTYDMITPPYNGSAKQPDAIIGLKESTSTPPVILEVGWTESYSQLKRDMDLLLHGSGGLVKVVILLKWRILKGKTTIGGFVETWRFQNGQSVRSDHEVIFPPPNPPTTQTLSLTFGEVFSPQIPPGHNSGDPLDLDVDKLRDIAGRVFTNLGYALLQ